jgi:hypothetical protein
MTTQNIFDLSDTWNAGGTTFTAIKMSVTDTASASGSLLIDLQVGGSSKFSVSKAGNIVSTSVGSASAPTFTVPGSGGGMGIFARTTSILGFAVNNAERMNLGTLGPAVRSDGYFAFSSTTDPSATPDVLLNRDAANTLAQRNGTNAQAFRVYNTFTDASNYERGKIQWDSNVLKIGTEKAGTGSARALEFQTDGTTRLTIGTGGTSTFGAGVLVGSNSVLGWSARSRMVSASNGVIAIYNDTETDFGRLQFGGTTSSFPALKRDATALKVRLADDSTDAPLTAAAITAMAATAIPAGGTQGAGLKVSSTADFGVFFGSGAPTLSAAKGSLYLRSDGSGINDRMYVNTDSATTWTAVVTAA